MGKAGDGGGNFNRNRIPAGVYRAKVVSVQDHESKGGDDMWLFIISPVEKYTNRKFPQYCGFSENQLWKIRQLFTAAGFSVKKAKMNIDPSKVVGREIGIEVDDDEYEGKEQSEIIDIFPVSELPDAGGVTDDEVEEDDEDEEDEPPARKTKAKAKTTKAKSKKRARDEDEDDEDDEDEDELDEMEIEEID